jgi:hypothetical protein
MIVPNLTGRGVWRCATLHIAEYWRFPGPIGPVMRGTTRASSWSCRIIPRGTAARLTLGTVSAISRENPAM